MRTLVNAVIAYFARSNTVHAHTRTRVKLIQSHTRSFAQTQMHGCRRTRRRRRIRTTHTNHAYADDAYGPRICTKKTNCLTYGIMLLLIRQYFKFSFFYIYAMVGVFCFVWCFYFFQK